MWEKLKNVPKVSKPLAFGCGFLNLLLPGSGTMIAACSAEDNVSKVQMAIAVLQFLTTLFLVGWLFSIYWSYLLINKAMEPEGGPAGMRYSGERHQSFRDTDGGDPSKPGYKKDVIDEFGKDVDPKAPRVSKKK